MRKEIRRNIVITIIIFICFNLIFLYFYNSVFSVNIIQDSPSSDSFVSGGIEAMTKAFRIDYLLPILIIVNILIIVISSISVSKYLIDFENLSIMTNLYSRFSKKTKTSKKIIVNEINNDYLLLLLEKSQIEEHSNNFSKFELTAISDNFLKKIDEFNWKNEDEKFKFIKEMLALTPEDREDILEYMFKKSVKNPL